MAVGLDPDMHIVEDRFAHENITDLLPPRLNTKGNPHSVDLSRVPILYRFYGCVLRFPCRLSRDRVNDSHSADVREVVVAPFTTDHATVRFFLTTPELLPYGPSFIRIECQQHDRRHPALNSPLLCELVLRNRPQDVRIKLGTLQLRPLEPHPSRASSSALARSDAHTEGHPLLFGNLVHSHHEPVEIPIQVRSLIFIGVELLKQLRNQDTTFRVEHADDDLQGL
nr:hypothetical protein [Schaalia cardiffensis]